jgi:hypothetical protein
MHRLHYSILLTTHNIPPAKKSCTLAERTRFFGVLAPGKWTVIGFFRPHKKRQAPYAKKEKIGIYTSFNCYRTISFTTMAQSLANRRYGTKRIVDPLLFFKNP